ncbi:MULTISPECIES: hypothetical protein [Nocardiaceae]|uniref:hypothetical protein n=1 Tax=Nocardiaceae TaxID=85025 RepID=UPI00068E6E61|nr:MULTISPECIES: hypothetical protein [Rhodococcus]
MSIGKPDAAALACISDSYRLGIGASDLKTYDAAAGGLLESWNKVEDLYSAIAPTSPELS